MGKRNNDGSVKNRHNETDVKEICLTNELVGIGADFTNSKSLNFVNLCNENCEKSSDEKNIEIFKKFQKEGGLMFF